MPKPDGGETRSDFIQRCVPVVMEDGTADSSEQAVAICNSIYERELAGMPNAKKPLIAIQADVSIKAAEGEGKPPRFDVLAYTGGVIAVPGYDRMVVVDLAGMTFTNSIVANLDHDSKRRVGHVTDKSTDGGQLRLSGFVSAATPAADEVVRSAANGFLWQASIEALPKSMETIAAGKIVTVNGKIVTGPLFVARKSVLKGFAFVSHGADDNTSVKIAAGAKGEHMDPELKTWIEAMGFVADELSDAQVAGLKATYDAKHERPAGSKKKLNDIVAEQLANRQREERITEITAEEIARNPANLEVIQALADGAIQAKWEVERFELELLRACRPITSPILRPRTEDRLTNKIIEAAVCRTGQLGSLEKHFDAPTLEAADRRFRDGLGLQDLLMTVARVNGCTAVSTRSSLREVMQAAFSPIKAASFSTLSLPGILSNTANKFLMEGWMAVDQTWGRISGRRSARDFKQMTTYSLTGDLTYEKVGPTGEIQHGTLGELSYTNKVETYAKMLAITRTDIINDDLGAITSVPRRLGRGAALSLNDIFWAAFLNNATFFTAARLNFDDGADTVLDLAGLARAETFFMNQTDPDGKPLALMPAILLVPPGHKATALTLMNSQFVVTGANTTIGSANVFQGRFRVESSPYLANSGFTGFSALAWYLLANPAELPVIEVAFLDGREVPVVETADADFNTLGVQMRGYHDFGVSLQEYRAGVKFKGEA